MRNAAADATGPSTTEAREMAARMANEGPNAPGDMTAALMADIPNMSVGM